VISPAPYDTIASVYDQYWGNEFAEFAQSAFQAHLVPVLPRRAAVLDLCCGTGLLIAHLDTLGYHTFGVDESAKMLEIAQRNAPRGQLQQADMASFHWSSSFDAVVCFYNSVNHTRSVEHLDAALANVARHLAPDGLFLFDYAAREAFERHWDSQEQIETEEGLTAMRYAYEPSGGRATCRIDAVEELARAQGTEICQMALEGEQIYASLDLAGLTIASETSMVGPNPVQGRRLILARKNKIHNIDSGETT
jgi:SAM-dependent methyltransferase